MGQVLRLPRPRRKHLVKWSAVRSKHLVEITVEWRTPDRAGCLIQTLTLIEFHDARDPDAYFWQTIENMRLKAARYGAWF